MSERFAMFFRKGALVALFSLFGFLAALAADGIEFDRTRLTIETAQGRKITLTVELAVDDAQRMRGLMYRKSMPADHGMLFDFGESRLVTMWMRNTVLPLDMLFIDQDGWVRHLRERAVPFSEEIISSGGEVRYVLELNAGSVKRLGIGIGSRVHLSSLAQKGD